MTALLVTQNISLLRLEETSGEKIEVIHNTVICPFQVTEKDTTDVQFCCSI